MRWWATLDTRVFGFGISKHQGYAVPAAGLDSIGHARRLRSILAIDDGIRRRFYALDSPSSLAVCSPRHSPVLRIATVPCLLSLCSPFPDLHLIVAFVSLLAINRFHTETSRYLFLSFSSRVLDSDNLVTRGLSRPCSLPWKGRNTRSVGYFFF